MAVSGRGVNKERLNAQWFQASSQISVNDLRSQHCATIFLIDEPCSGTTIHKSDHKSSTSNTAATRESAEKTRTALSALCVRPTDRAALTTLWLENRQTIEVAMRRHIRALSDSSLLERLLIAVASHSRFFCDGLDEPKAWIARCANLEARRIALQLSE